MEKEQLKTILEAVLMAASSPLSVDGLLNIFEEHQRPERDELQAVLDEMISDCDARSYELKKISSGYRFQVKKDYADFVSRLWEDKPARYSRALLETLALIAYRQPITRGEIEAVRGVSVSSTIIKTLDERDWIKVVGHRDVPGKPALYATTKAFLDYFDLASLDDLPSLQDIRDIDQINAELDLRMPGVEQTDAENTVADEQATDDTETLINLEVADESEEDTVDSDSTPVSESEQVVAAEQAESSAPLVDEEASDKDETVVNLDTAADESEEGLDDSTSSSSPTSSSDDNNEHLDAAPASAEH